MIVEDEEQSARATLLDEAALERSDLLFQFVGHFAAIAIQKHIRGYSTRKRTKVKRKRLNHTALLLQRITRAGLARMTIRLLRLLPEANPPRLRMLMKYRYNHKGKIGRNPTLRLAAVTLLQRLCRRLPAILRTQHQRDRYDYVNRCVVVIQAATRRMLARKRYGTVLQECKRSRHETLLKAYVEQQVAVRLLSRVEQKERDNERERLVCRQMQQGRSYAESVAIVEQKYPVKNLSSSSRALAAVQNTRSIHALLREVTHSHFCNHRQIVGLNEPNSDSDDDSIDEELLQPPSLQSRRARASHHHSHHRSRKSGRSKQGGATTSTQHAQPGEEEDDSDSTLEADAAIRPLAHHVSDVFAYRPTKSVVSGDGSRRSSFVSRMQQQQSRSTSGTPKKRGPKHPSPFDVVSRLAYGW